MKNEGHAVFEQLSMSYDAPVAESPLWNEFESAIYWREYSPEFGSCICRKFWRNLFGEVERFFPNLGLIGGFVFTDENNLLLFAQHGRVWRWRIDEKPILIAELPNATDKTFFNDVIADSNGGVFCGQLAEDYFNPKTRGKSGALWHLDASGKLESVDNTIGICPNGMGFSPDEKYFYFAVSDQNIIYRYEYDNVTGHLASRSEFIRYSCDGMTGDSAGNLWLACCRAGLVCFSPKGEELYVYPCPENVRAISSVTFGGPDYKSIFTTIANFDAIKSESRNIAGGGILLLKQKNSGMPDFLAANL